MAHVIYSQYLFHSSNVQQGLKPVCVVSYLIISFILLIQPILICFKVDSSNGGKFEHTSWFEVFITFRIYFLLAMKPKWAAGSAHFIQHLLLLVSFIFLGYKLDGVLASPYSLVFIPIYICILVQDYILVQIMVSIHREVSKMVSEILATSCNVFNNCVFNFWDLPLLTSEHHCIE